MTGHALPRLRTYRYGSRRVSFGHNAIVSPPRSRVSNDTAGLPRQEYSTNMNCLLEALARWYFLNYLKPLVDAHLKAETAKAAMPRKRYIGEPPT